MSDSDEDCVVPTVGKVNGVAAPRVKVTARKSTGGMAPSRSPAGGVGAKRNTARINTFNGAKKSRTSNEDESGSDEDDIDDDEELSDEDEDDGVAPAVLARKKAIAKPKGPGGPAGGELEVINLSDEDDDEDDDDDDVISDDDVDDDDLDSEDDEGQVDVKKVANGSQ